MRERSAAGRQLPASSVGSDSPVRDVLAALSRVGQATLDVQPLVIGREKKGD
jgi:hypothetical protein